MYAGGASQDENFIIPGWQQSQLPNTVAQEAFYKRVVSDACRTCHTTREGDNRLGPNLSRVIGRKAGSLPNYNYSESMKKADLVWDKQNLDRFIANPDAVVSGNNMKPYGGLTSGEDRAKIIAFLAQAK